MNLSSSTNLLGYGNSKAIVDWRLGDWDAHKFINIYLLLFTSPPVSSPQASMTSTVISRIPSCNRSNRSPSSHGRKRVDIVPCNIRLYNVY